MHCILSHLGSCGSKLHSSFSDICTCHLCILVAGIFRRRCVHRPYVELTIWPATVLERPSPGCDGWHFLFFGCRRSPMHSFVVWPCCTAVSLPSRSGRWSRFSTHCRKKVFEHRAHKGKRTCVLRWPIRPEQAADCISIAFA